MDITVDEGAVFEAAAGGSGFGSCDEALGEVDAGGVDLRVFLRESTGIEAGTAAEFDHAVLRSQLFFDDTNIGTKIRGPVDYVVGTARALELFDPAPSTLALAGIVPAPAKGASHD